MYSNITRAFDAETLGFDPPDHGCRRMPGCRVSRGVIFLKGDEMITMHELRVKAKKFGINSFGKTKENLIKEIQIAEGGDQCFGRSVEICDQWGCRSRSLCFDDARAFLERPKPKKSNQTRTENTSKRRRK